MAKLNPNLIFSMTRDLSELHEIGCEMMEHIGRCEIVSWRYPDRLIKDVHVDVDSETYDTSGKYVLLLEMTIDRLYLVLNMALDILDSLPELAERNMFRLPKNVCRPIGISFGTLAAFFWKRLQALSATKDLPLSTQDTISKLNVNISQSSLTVSNLNCDGCLSAIKMVKLFISRLEECMIQLKIVSIIADQRPIIEKNISKLTQLEAMQKWTEAIITDVKTLTSYAKRKTAEYSFLMKDFENIKKENDKVLKKLRHHQGQCLTLEKRVKDDESKISLLTITNNELQMKYIKLNETLTILEDLCKTHENKIRDLENKLQETEINHQKSENILRADYSKQITTLNVDKDYWTNKFTKNKELIDNLENQIKIERDKHKEQETTRHEQFRKEKLKLEEEKLQIGKENKTLTEKVEHLKSQSQQKENEYKVKVLNLNEEILKLQNELKQHKDREIVLIRSPDLNGPIIVANNGKQNPLQDMEEQLEANELRVKLLQDQNSNLRNTIAKLRKLVSLPDKQIGKKV